MSLLNAFKLEKLKILAYTDHGRGTPAPDHEFEAMFNPEQLKQAYGVKMSRPTGPQPGPGQAVFYRTDPTALQLELYLDGTGVTDQVLLPPGPAAQTVSERVETFLNVAFRVNGETHQSNYLLVQWGDFWSGGGFRCRLKSVEITYTRFERDGKPLRAKLDANFLEDISLEEQHRETNATSPDITHRHVVRAGETLPALARRVYGSAEHVAMVARANGLDGLRILEPGTELTFPPLERRRRTPGGAP